MAHEAASVGDASIDAGSPIPKPGIAHEARPTYSRQSKQSEGQAERLASAVLPGSQPATAPTQHLTGSSSPEAEVENGAAPAASPATAASPQANRDDGSVTLSDEPSPPAPRAAWAAGEVQWDGHQCTTVTDAVSPSPMPSASQCCQVLGCKNSLLLLKNYFRCDTPRDRTGVPSGLMVVSWQGRAGQAVTFKITLLPQSSAHAASCTEPCYCRLLSRARALTPLLTLTASLHTPACLRAKRGLAQGQALLA
jgi:hypothetical protein